MKSNKLFMKKYGKTITQVLHNTSLRHDILTNRINFILKSMNNSREVEIITSFEEKIEEIIQNTGKNKFSQEDIDIILRNLLGLEIRDYDKSHLVNLDLNEIKSVTPKSEKGNQPYPFGDTTITKMGTLTYTTFMDVKNLVGVQYYKIEKQDSKGKTFTYKVFSHINMEQMKEDDDYREAVLETLLDENNMTKTNCGGYIGTIETVERAKELEDSVKANSKYALIFNSTEATAVVKLRNIVKEKVEQKQKQKKGEER